MTSTDIQTATVPIDSDGVTIPAYLAHPTTTAGLPAVVVIQEVFGVNSHIRDVTERIAQLGYIAIAPHIYHRQVPGFDVGYTDAELKLGRQYKNGTHATELLQDIKGAIAYAQSNFSAVPPNAGCIGFCFGGHVAYLAATLPAIAATASFYGAGIGKFTPGGTEPTLTKTEKIQGRIDCFFGLQDPLISISEIEEIEAALGHYKINHRMHRYPNASHGFFCDQRDTYNEVAAIDAWDHVKQLFNDHLKEL
jgi:carboxymethylenebutenolidase